MIAADSWWWAHAAQPAISSAFGCSPYDVADILRKAPPLTLFLRRWPSNLPPLWCRAKCTGQKRLEVLGTVGWLPAGLLLSLTRAGLCVLLLLLPLPVSYLGHVDFQATLILTLLTTDATELVLILVGWSLACHCHWVCPIGVVILLHLGEFSLRFTLWFCWMTSSWKTQDRVFLFKYFTIKNFSFFDWYKGPNEKLDISIRRLHHGRYNHWWCFAVS